MAWQRMIQQNPESIYVVTLVNGKTTKGRAELTEGGIQVMKRIYNDLHNYEKAFTACKWEQIKAVKLVNPEKKLRKKKIIGTFVGLGVFLVIMNALLKDT